MVEKRHFFAPKKNRAGALKSAKNPNAPCKKSTFFKTSGPGFTSKFPEIHKMSKFELMRGVEVRVWHFSAKEPRTARGHWFDTYIKKWSIGYILDLGGYPRFRGF